MSFSPTAGKAQRSDSVDVYMPPRTVYVLSGEARCDWAHSIPGRSFDLVEDNGGQVTLLRETRVSVTFRWMKKGADELSEEA